jgi:hypothetical protein
VSRGRLGRDLEFDRDETGERKIAHSGIELFSAILRAFGMSGALKGNTAQFRSLLPFSSFFSEAENQRW